MKGPGRGVVVGIVVVVGTTGCSGSAEVCKGVGFGNAIDGPATELGSPAAVAAAAARSGTVWPQGKAVPDEQDPAWDVSGTTVRYPLGDGSVYRVTVRELRPDVWTYGGEVAVCRPS